MPNLPVHSCKQPWKGQPAATRGSNTRTVLPGQEAAGRWDSLAFFCVFSTQHPRKGQGHLAMRQSSYQVSSFCFPSEVPGFAASRTCQVLSHTLTNSHMALSFQFQFRSHHLQETSLDFLRHVKLRVGVLPKSTDLPEHKPSAHL